jgi:hypothetical protein
MRIFHDCLYFYWAGVNERGPHGAVPVRIKTLMNLFEFSQQQGINKDSWKKVLIPARAKWNLIRQALNIFLCGSSDYFVECRYRDSVTRFLTLVFFHQSTHPRALIHGLKPFRIWLRIYGEIWYIHLKCCCFSSFNETAESLKKFNNIIFPKKGIFQHKTMLKKYSL